LSDEALISIKEATSYVEWVTVMQTGEPSRHVTSHLDQLSLAIPRWVGKASFNEIWGVSKQAHRAMH